MQQMLLISFTLQCLFCIYLSFTLILQSDDTELIKNFYTLRTLYLEGNCFLSILNQGFTLIQSAQIASGHKAVIHWDFLLVFGINMFFLIIFKQFFVCFVELSIFFIFIFSVNVLFRMLDFRSPSVLIADLYVVKMDS